MTRLFYHKALLWALKLNYSKEHNVHPEKIILEKVNNMEDCISSLYLSNASWNFELHGREFVQ